MINRILHIANISNNPCNGVCVAVPNHVYYQNRIISAALLNINNCQIDVDIDQFVYTGDNWRNDVHDGYKYPDLIIFHGIYQFPYIKIAKSLRKLGIPYIIIPHGELVEGAQNKKKLKKAIANVIFFNRFIYGALAIQCLSRNELETTNFKVNKFISSNGIVIKSSKEKKFHSDKIEITYIGRLEWYIKGLDILIEAVARLSEEFKKNRIKLSIYGPDIKGRLNVVNEIIRKYNVSELISSHPPVTGKEKEEILNNSDIFIQTSRNEGMPMGILEALSMGVPCVVTKGTSLGSFIEQSDAGWVADNNIDSVADKLIQAIKERNIWLQKSHNARIAIQTHYTWNKISQTAIKEYNNLLFRK